MSKFKYGPWACTYTSNHAHDYRLTKPDGSPLPVNAEANDHSEQRAYARLIAAAPDLLKALEWCADTLAVFVDDGSAAPDSVVGKNLTTARAAIARAEAANV